MTWFCAKLDRCDCPQGPGDHCGSAYEASAPDVAEARRAAHLLEAAKAFVAAPDDMDARTAFVRATFNHDLTAAAIVRLASRPFPTGEAP